MILQTTYLYRLGALLCMLVPLNLFASHHLSARIEWEQINGREFTIRVVTYSDPSAALVDRCVVDLEIWNTANNTQVGSIVNMPRVNGPLQTDSVYPSITCINENMGVYVSPTIKRNVYEAVYEFPGNSTFELRYDDLSRIDNMINIPNSGSQTVGIYARIKVDGSVSPTNSPTTLNPLELTACAGGNWYYQPGWFDQDGDSLTFWSVPAKQYDPPAIPTMIDVSGYQTPSAVGSGSFWVSGFGNVLWQNTGNIIGGYGYAILVQEWRAGNLISESLFDATVFVVNNNCTVGTDPAVRDLAVEVEVFPNPATDLVRFSQPAEEAVLWDIRGHLMRKKQRTSELPLENLAPGIYFLDLIVEGQQYRKKILVSP